MFTSTRHKIVDLIISHKETGGKPRIHAEDRPELTRHLIRVLTCPETLRRHLDLFARLKFDPIRFVIPPKHIKKMAEHGLDVLSDTDIAWLLLAPVGLTALHETIIRDQPTVWHEALSEAGTLAEEAAV